MHIIVSYDVETVTAAGKRRLRRVAKICKSYGVRVQYSVFECAVEPKDLVRMRASLMDAIQPERDSLRLWYVSDDDARRAEHYGVRQPLDPEGTLIV